MSENQSPDPVTKKRFVWPWIVVMMVLIGIALAVLSMRREAQRIQNQRQYEIPRESR
jgi:F0F1-type ATP synthase assembly protein I